MCSDCVRAHLVGIIDDVSAQLNANGAAKPDCLTLYFEPCLPCSPFNINEKAICNRRRQFHFPGESDQETATFTTILRLCGLLADNLTLGKVATIRDLFYQDVSLFRTQNNVVKALDRITKLLLVPREYLNVLPSPNGLVAGDLTIAMEGGDLVEVLRSNGPSLIPAAAVLYVSAPRAPSFLLVVEKEAVFSHLQNELPEGVLITGRGFPDRATRRMVKLMTVTYPDMPVLGLFDSDPHGILILRNYENGSDNSVEQQESLQMTYLGVSLLEYSEGLVPLTPNDIRVSMSTLQKPWIHEPRYSACKTELQRGLFMHQKGEMNLLDGNRSQRLSNYVRKKIDQLLATSNPGGNCKPNKRQLVSSNKPRHHTVPPQQTLAYATRQKSPRKTNAKRFLSFLTFQTPLSKRHRTLTDSEERPENQRGQDQNELNHVNMLAQI